ncbi:hypothetical protein FOS14_16400 [Skermania sp. ID1734]|uniref:DUF6928 family protein n=1 Tax=Skermania sp. ID1734 TaxID=2597516 RepID=UPI00117FCD6A|nr:hypothetical protein [Skermania sp. ID1734]TSD96629.1 hypothetical protein FOS14_16400 [Skermania sp. ID1734]
MLGKFSTIWYVDVPDPAQVLRDYPDSDADAAAALAARMFPDHDAAHRPPVPLRQAAAARPGLVSIGCFGPVTVVCTPELSLARPGTLSPNWIRPLAAEHSYLIAADPANRWGSFAQWERGELRRAFSATRVHIIEDDGLPQPWELPFWSGEHPISHDPGVLPNPQSLPFDPQHFAVNASAEWLGIGYGATDSGDDINADKLTVCCFELRNPAAQTRSPDLVGEAEPAATQGNPVLRMLRRFVGGD